MKTFCPFCGKDVTEIQEREYGIICPDCKNDFWRSEALPENYKEKGLKTINNLPK